MKEYKFEFPFKTLIINILVFLSICMLGFVVLYIVPRNRPLGREGRRAGVKETATDIERQSIKKVSKSISAESYEMTERIRSCFSFAKAQRKINQKPHNHGPLHERKFIGRIRDEDGDWIFIWKNLENGIVELEKK